MLPAIASGLPAAMAIALSPFPVIGIVLLLAGRDGRRNGVLFAAAWMTGLTAVVVVIALAFAGADEGGTTSAIADWARILGGGALVVVGVKKFLGRPGDGETAPTPKWMASLDEATGGRALGLGALLGGANPKNFALAAAAATAMAEVGLDDGELGVAVVVFVLMSSWSVLGAVAVRLLGGRRGETVLEGVRRFMVAHSLAIGVTVLLILGVKILGDGLSGLSA